jgi:class 3 adenylate cyclase
MAARPEPTRYALNGDVNIAYTTLGDGPLDVLYVPTWMSVYELFWEEPRISAFFARIAEFARVILFDRRGSGLSDPLEGDPTLEEQMEDVIAVLDATGSDQCAVFSQLEGGPMACLFAATHPERVRSLILNETFARTTQCEDMPWLRPAAERTESLGHMGDVWGSGSRIAYFAPTYANDPALVEWFGRLERFSASPGTMRRISRLVGETDVRAVLPSIRVPTLVIHRPDNVSFDARHAHYLEEHIPEARRVELPGADALPIVGDADELLDELEEFVTGARRDRVPDRVLATVMFTDIVDSTRRAAELGDAGWRTLLEAHNKAVRGELARWRGREVKATGDGFLATFDGPARAIRSARAISESVGHLGVEIRTGLHTGEIEVMGDDVGGMAVHIGARVGALATAGEVLVSSTVKDLVVGSGLEFADRGEHELKGVPGEWRLFALEG